MLSTSALPLLHVHAYVDHDHPEHHHGPASHEHSAAAHPHAWDSHAPDDATQLEDCDPDAHAVAVVFTCVAPHPDRVPAPVALATIIVAPPEQVWRHLTPSDVRAHSPPRLTDAPLRAPPVVHPA